MTQRLDELARTDPAVAPLARLQAAAFRAAAAPGWDAGVPPLSRERLADGLPLLHGQLLAADPERVRRLLVELATEAGRNGADTVLSGMRRALAETIAPLALLEASVRQDGERLAEVAATAEVESGLLATLAGLGALPLLQACGRAAAPLLAGVPWEAGYCPVCAAWPVLAEVRGLERTRWLRCGRCAAGWAAAHQGCVFCGNTDFQALGYLAPEADTESRRAATCERCRAYLKTLTVLGPLAPVEIAVQDASTLELDMAALEQEFARPEKPGFPLDVQVAAADPAEHDAPDARGRRKGWLGWRT